MKRELIESFEHSKVCLWLHYFPWKAITQVFYDFGHMLFFLWEIGQVFTFLEDSWWGINLILSISKSFLSCDN